VAISDPFFPCFARRKQHVSDVGNPDTPVLLSVRAPVDLDLYLFSVRFLGTQFPSPYRLPYGYSVLSNPRTAPSKRTYMRLECPMFADFLYPPLSLCSDRRSSLPLGVKLSRCFFVFFLLRARLGPFHPRPRSLSRDAAPYAVPHPLCTACCATRLSFLCKALLL